MSEKNFEIWIEDVQALRPDALRGDLAALQAGPTARSRIDPAVMPLLHAELASDRDILVQEQNGEQFLAERQRSRASLLHAAAHKPRFAANTLSEQARKHRPRKDDSDQKISLEKLERSLEDLVDLVELKANTFADAEVATGMDHPDPTSSMTAEVACPVQEEVSEVKTPFDAVQKMVCIGFDLQSTLDGSDSPVFITVAENVFLLVYTIEWALRVLSMGWCAYYTDPWCLLDFTLLVCGAIGGVVVPVLRSTGQDMVSLGWLQSILVIRALRLLRLVRALRALTYFRTVWRLVHGLLTSWNAMLSTLALITLTLYTSACIAIEIVTKDVELNSNPTTAPIVQANFSSLGTTFLTLTQFVALDSAAAVYKPSLGSQSRQSLDKVLVEAKPILIFYFGSIVLFVSIALMNLVTAVLVEGALNHAQSDRDLEKIDRNERLSKALTRLVVLFGDMDKNGDGTVTLEEMQAVPPNLLPPEIFENDLAVTIAEVFQVLDVDDQGTLDQREFVEGLLAVYLQDMPLAQLETLKLLQKQNNRLDEIYKAQGLLQVG
ncbi:Scn11a [Symbiodinium sp. CCMP2456]|nr:Scn11a [Symbiodinium sp. CCMP2456]